MCPMCNRSVGSESVAYVDGQRMQSRHHAIHFETAEAVVMLVTVLGRGDHECYRDATLALPWAVHELVCAAATEGPEALYVRLVFYINIFLLFSLALTCFFLKKLKKIIHRFVQPR